MRKLTINDFSGGIQESTVSDDFSPRQWAQLKGIIPDSELNFESQWPIQTVGTSFTDVRAVYPLPSTIGTFLVAIKTNGTIWWTKAPNPDAAYTVSNAISWTQITTAANLGWASGNNTTQPTRSVLANPDYKFICAVPLEVFKYVRKPKTGDQDNVTADEDDPAAPRGVASGVLLHSTTVSGGADIAAQQALVAFVDTTSTGSVKIIVFPDIRRIPTHSDKADFINAKVINNSGQETIVSVANGWPLAYTPSVRHHPYTYLNKDGALLPGKGIIPRANVGTMKGGVLLLGDIEWRSTFGSDPVVLDSVPLLSVDNKKVFGLDELRAGWPNGVVKTARVLYNEGGGIVYLNSSQGVSARITNKALTTNVATLTTAANHNFEEGETIEVVGVDPTFNGIHTLTSVSGTSLTFALTADNVTSTAVTDETARVFAYKYKMEVGQYQEIPNSWNNIWIAASINDTEIRVARQFNLATHILNDANTGPYRNAFYFSAGEIDTFDSRAVIIPGKTDVALRGMHAIDDTLIVISTAGSDLDGVYRIRGFFSRLINYSSNSDPNAIRLELIRGGVGAPARTTTVHKNYSCLWAEAGIVAFIDRLGGVWYTNGQECDRLDRFGPRAPARATEDDHVASFGKHLFVWRANRLLVFTIMESAEGQGSGCWTEVNMPGVASSMVGSRSNLYFVRTQGGVSQVCRMSPSGPNAERACIDGSPLTITVSTATFGAVSEHRRTVWHRFGMTFSTPTSCTVGTVRVQSTGALNIGTDVTADAVFPDVQYKRTLNRTYNNKGILGEFTIPAGIGQQAEASATISFTGYVQLQSASFWITGSDPRSGDL
jgi:hypothetical protein